jgi:hypothetical protein
MLKYEPAYDSGLWQSALKLAFLTLAISSMNIFVVTIFPIYFRFFSILISVSDPQSLYADPDPDPAFMTNADTYPIPDPGEN